MSNRPPSEFILDAERHLLDLAIESSRAEWVSQNFITEDSQALAARASARLISETVRLAKEAATFPVASLSGDLARKVHLLRNSLPLVAPSDPAQAIEVSEIVGALQATYSKGRYRPASGKEPLHLEGLSEVLATSRDPAVLADTWTGWHAIARPMRAPFQRYVSLANQGARELGFADAGAMWRSKYDMEPDAFGRDVERVWQQVRPLYLQLHAFVRARLRRHYGDHVVPANGPIPAHLLGNMWAQSWENIEPVLGLTGTAPTYDLTEILRRRGTTPTDMVRFAEQFFVSLGFDKLPASFWERSLFVRPRDRDVVCHASAWDIDYDDDLRIKMCIDITGEDFRVIHHELGHNYYQRAYRRQPFLYRDSANDGFHEAIGDTIALSVTPEYLVKVGLLDRAPDASGDIGLLLRVALEKLAFLPFGYLVDQWRWEVFSGAVGPERYTARWWELKHQYQGVAPPTPRSEAEFDPGAKAHVPSNVPYMRYFLAHILQFQFHRALAKTVGWSGPLHRCSIYGDPRAGQRLKATLEMGASHPWPEALEVLTGDRSLDAGALLEYFAPLSAWLERENRGEPIGW